MHVFFEHFVELLALAERPMLLFDVAQTEIERCFGVVHTISEKSEQLRPQRIELVEHDAVFNHDFDRSFAFAVCLRLNAFHTFGHRALLLRQRIGKFLPDSAHIGDGERRVVVRLWHDGSFRGLWRCGLGRRSTTQ